MSGWEFVDYQTHGPICTITMNRPDRRNAVDGVFAAELLAAFLKFEADETARVAVFTGSHGHFCAGGDLKAVGDPSRRSRLDTEGRESGPMGPSRMQIAKPVIAAINGYAVAGGLELALLADMRVADEDAVFGVLERVARESGAGFTVVSEERGIVGLGGDEVTVVLAPDGDADGPSVELTLAVTQMDGRRAAWFRISRAPLPEAVPDV